MKPLWMHGVPLADPRWLEHALLVLGYRWLEHRWDASTPWRSFNAWYAEKMR